MGNIKNVCDADTWAIILQFAELVQLSCAQSIDIADTLT